MPVLLLLVALPLLEIALFVVIGGRLGVGLTLLWVIASAILGVALMRREPQRSATELRQTLAADLNPANPMAHSALRMLGALMLAAPGFLTDALGLLLLLPPVRDIMLHRFLSRTRYASFRSQPDIIDGDYTRADGQTDPTHPDHRVTQARRLGQNQD